MTDANVTDRGEERSERAAVPVGSRWDVDVDVYLHSADPVSFSIESYLQSDEESEDLIFYNRNHSGFNVRFHLHDETGSGFQFPSPSRREDGIWSVVGPDALCPTSASYGVFPKSSIDVRDQGSLLIAYNPNSGAAVGPFKYTLNVSTTGGPPYLPLDPGGTNMNGISNR